MLDGGAGWTGLGAVEEVRVTCHLTQLHDHVHETRLALLLAGQAVDGVDILFKHRAIPFPLHLGERNEDVNLFLYGGSKYVRYE